jgi:hypothetical protein
MKGCIAFLVETIIRGCVLNESLEQGPVRRNLQHLCLVVVGDAWVLPGFDVGHADDLASTISRVSISDLTPAFARGDRPDLIDDTNDQMIPDKSKRWKFTTGAGGEEKVQPVDHHDKPKPPDF